MLYLIISLFTIFHLFAWRCETSLLQKHGASPITTKRRQAYIGAHLRLRVEKAKEIEWWWCTNDAVTGNERIHVPLTTPTTRAVGQLLHGWRRRRMMKGRLRVKKGEEGYLQSRIHASKRRWPQIWTRYRARWRCQRRCSWHSSWWWPRWRATPRGHGGSVYWGRAGAGRRRSRWGTQRSVGKQAMDRCQVSKAWPWSNMRQQGTYLFVLDLGDVELRLRCARELELKEVEDGLDTLLELLTLLHGAPRQLGVLACILCASRCVS
jgi:hypothetical protein